MSISSIRNAFEKKGCQVLLIVIGVAVIASLIVPSLPGLMGRGQQGQSPEAQVVVAKVGASEVRASDLESAVKLVLQGRQLSISDPEARFYTYAAGVLQAVNTAILKGMISEKGIAVTDETLVAVAGERIDMEIESMKFQLSMSGRLKPNASAAEINTELEKSLGGKTATQFREEQVKAVGELLENDNTRSSVEVELLGAAVLRAYAGRQTVTDAELKKSYETLVLDEIPFNDLAKGLADREAAAKKALADIKGGQKFDAVKAAVAPKAAKVPVRILRSEIDNLADLKALRDLKVGEISDVVMRGGSPVIYRLVKVDAQLPQDFETNKQRYMDQVKSVRGQTQFQEDFKAYEEKVKIAWEIPAWQLVYEMGKEVSDRESGESLNARREKFMKFADDAAGFSANAPAGLVEILGLARYVAFNEAYKLSKPEEQAEMKQDRIDSIEGVLGDVESIPLRIELAKLKMEQDDPTGAVEQIVEAIRINTDYTAVGSQDDLSIRATVKAWQAAKKLQPEDQKQIDDALAKWQKDRAEFIAEEAAAKAEEEKISKQLDEEAKRQQAEDAKAAGTNKK